MSTELEPTEVTAPARVHTPVMLREVLEALAIPKLDVIAHAGPEQLARKRRVLAQRRGDQHTPQLVDFDVDRAGHVNAAQRHHRGVELRKCRQPLLERLPLLKGIGDQAGIEAGRDHDPHIAIASEHLAKARWERRAPFAIYGVLVASAKHRRLPARLALVTTSCHGDPDPKRIAETESTSFREGQPRDFVLELLKSRTYIGAEANDLF